MHQRKVFCMIFSSEKKTDLKTGEKKGKDELVYTYFCIMVLQLKLLLFVLKNVELFSQLHLLQKIFFCLRRKKYLLDVSFTKRSKLYIEYL